MTSTVRSSAAAVAGGSGSAARLYRVAGVSALVGAVAYLVQPIVVFVVNPPTTGPGGYPVATDLIGLRTLAPLEVVEFTTIGVATIVLAVAVYRLSVLRGERTSIPLQLGAILGVLAGCGWIATAASILSTYGLFATNLAEITSDEKLQQVAIQGALLGSGLLCIPIFGMAGWFVLLATSGRRQGVVGWPLAVVAFAVTAMIAIPAAVLLVPFGILVLIPAFVTFGVAFLVKGRRA